MPTPLIGRITLVICLVATGLGWPSLASDANDAVAERPNIVVIMVDDMGFSDLGCYGGEIDTPRIDALAASGIKFSQFYNACRCCPTRASLLTGLYPHKVGLGFMTAKDYGKPGYRADLSRECVTIAESLRASDYATYMVGKWHVCHDFSEHGPKHNWPLQRGFDKYFGTLIAAGSLWNPPTLTEGNAFVEPEGDFYYTEAITEKAIDYLDQTPGDKPFFLYMAHPAPHWPLHARAEEIEKYRGRFAAGWDTLREKRRQRLIELGLIDADWPLSQRDEHCVAWDSLDNQQQTWQQTRMEAYAAMIDHVDQSVGRIVDALEKRGELDNTLIMILSDNGGESLEHPNGEIGDSGQPWAVMRYVPLWTRDGHPVIAGDVPGIRPGPNTTYAGYGANWANLSNTPFRRFKKYVHEGGIASPLIMHWPSGMQAQQKIYREPAHVIDLMATCLDVASDNGSAHSLDGTSLLPILTGNALPARPLFWEHQGNRAVRRGKWKLVSVYQQKWELYDIEADRTETQDLALEHQVIVRELESLYERWAAESNVLPWEELAISEIASKDSPLRRSDAELEAYFKALRAAGTTEGRENAQP